jgi:outer membrane receptor protein involved in Fe transport
VETSIDRRSYSVANDLQARTGTISDVLRNVPSVQVDVNGNVTLRGDGNITVLVDGRPSAQFSRENLAQALQSVPADQVDRIEVITNPSAEFRADGSAGIINLVMKKARGAGKTGSLRIGATSTGFYDTTLSRGFNDDKLSVVQSLSFRHARIRQDGEYRRELAGGGSSLDIIAGSADPNAAQGRMAADYDLNATTRLSASVAAFWQAGTQRFEDDFTQVDAAGVTVADFERRSAQDITGRNGQVDFTVRNRWADNHTFTVNAAFSDNTGLSDRTDLTTRNVPPAAPFAQRVIRNNNNRRSALTADFQKPVGDAQLKAGYLFEYIDNLIEHGGGTGTAATGVARDPSQTDFFSDVETYNNAYVTLQKKVGKVTALAGVRVESVNLDLDRLTANVQYEQDYERIYPTLHLSYPLGEGRSLVASYSKRVQRPAPVDLDPRRFSANGNVVIEGNPFLTPQDTDSYELVFEKRKGQAFTLVTAYHRQTNNAFSAVITDLGGGVLLQTRANLGRQSNTGVEWTMGNRLTPKLNYNLSVNAYETKIGGGGGVITADSSAFTSFGRANLTWQATPKDMFQFNVFANGKQLLPQGYVEPSVSGNIGYRHNFNEKLSVMVVVRDPFDSLKNTLVIVTPAGRETRVQRSNNRAVSLALVWNFAGRPRDTGFDFAPGGTAGGAPTIP